MPETLDARAETPAWEPREGEYCRREFVGVQVRRGTGRDGEDTRTTITVNTVGQDRHGTVIVPDGARLDNYNRNPVVLINHSFSLLAGRSSVGLRGGQLVAHMEDEDWDLEDEEIAKWHRKVKKGLMRAASIGFIPLRVERELIDPAGDPHDYKNIRYRITEWELLEWSFVSVPSNPEAVVTERQIGASPNDFRALQQQIAELRTLLAGRETPQGEQDQEGSPSAPPATDAPDAEAAPEAADVSEEEAPEDVAEVVTQEPEPSPQAEPEQEPARLIRVDIATLRAYEREVAERRRAAAILQAKRLTGRA